VRILEQHNRRLLARDRLHCVDKRAQGLVLEFLRRYRSLAIARLARNRQHCGDEAHILAWASVLADHERFQFVEFFLLSILSSELQGALEIVDDWIECAVGMLRRTEVSQARMRFAR
jgi:hypothetical protein